MFQALQNCEKYIFLRIIKNMTRDKRIKVGISTKHKKL